MYFAHNLSFEDAIHYPLNSEKSHVFVCAFLTRKVETYHENPQVKSSLTRIQTKAHLSSHRNSSSVCVVIAFLGVLL